MDYSLNWNPLFYMLNKKLLKIFSNRTLFPTHISTPVFTDRHQVPTYCLMRLSSRKYFKIFWLKVLWSDMHIDKVIKYIAVGLTVFGVVNILMKFMPEYATQLPLPIYEFFYSITVNTEPSSTTGTIPLETIEPEPWKT